MKHCLHISILLILALLVSIPSAAQDTASLTGTVFDSAGAVLPAAAINITNTATGTVRQLVSNSQGVYLAAALPAGNYDIAVSAAGFRTQKISGVTLRVAQNARIDITLQVGKVEIEVMVKGEALAKVNTQSSENAGTITGTEIRELQLNGRNFTQLITLVPGVSNQTGQDEGVVGVQGNVNYSINGGRVENNNWEVDGGDVMDNGSNSTLNVYPSIEAIDEVEVLTSNYGAQYGRNSSGTIEVETKSGTNRFHGSVYEFLRNEAFNAHNYFDLAGAAKSPYKKHDFGYTLGGPIWKNRTFFFWSQNWRRENIPQNFWVSVPSASNRAGDFNDICNNASTAAECPVDPSTGLPYPGNVLPSIDANGAILQNMIPLPTTGSGADSIFAGAVGHPTRWREELVRIDHDINSRVRVTFRNIHDQWNTVTPTVAWESESFPTIGTHFVGPGESAVARVTATVTPTLLNEFAMSYTTDHISQRNTNPAVWTRTADFTMGGMFSDFGGKLPNFSVHTQGAYGGGFSEGPGAFPWNNSNPTYTLRDNVSKSLGKHNLEFGGYFVAAQKNEQAYIYVQGDISFDESATQVTTGNGFADLLLGNIASYSQDSASPKYYLRYKIFEPYFQDDFHVNKRLTLNLGFRLSLFGTYRERYKQVYNWNPDAYNAATAPQIDVDGSVTGQPGALILSSDTTAFDGMIQCGGAGVPPGCLKGHLFNPAPRVGFAWDLFGDGKTSIRGAYGVFFDHTNGEEGNAENLEGTPPLVEEPTEYNVTGYENVGGNGLLFPLSAISIPNKAIWPYMQQWHLDVQKEIFGSTVATVSYVGSKGTHLTLQREFNQLHPIDASANPFQPGQPITDAICQSQGGTATEPTFEVNGNTVTGNAAINLAVACGNDPNPFRPYYSLGSLQRVEPQANSNYNALQFSLRRTSGPLMLSIAYTYSHSLDNSSDKADGNFVNSYNVSNNYASSNFDQRQILTASWVYGLPFRGGGWSHTVLGGWQYAGIMTSQSGTPFSVINYAYWDSAGVANGSGTGSYADRVGDPYAVPADKYSSDPAIKGPLLFNPGAYTQTQGLTFGNSGRNSLNMPHRTDFDMSLYKTFNPSEKVALQFRAEGFNIFNHTQWSSLNTGVGGDNFLRATGAHMARVFQFGMKLSF